MALLLVLGAGLPGAIAAVAGPQLALPICTPDGPKPPEKAPGDDQACQHCRICPQTTNASAVVPVETVGGWLTPAPARQTPQFPAKRAPRDRAELAPLSLRGPPST